MSEAENPPARHSILITGADGMLGQALIDRLGPDHRVLATDRSSFDITERAQIDDRLGEIAPDVVIN